MLEATEQAIAVDRPMREMADLYPSRVNDLERECSSLHEVISTLIDVLHPVICEDRVGAIPADPSAPGGASPLMGVLEGAGESVMRARHRIEQIIGAVTV